MTNSLESLISQIVDPALNDKKLRSGYLNEICERIKTDSNEVPSIVKLLTHKVLSPNQSEASNALNSLDFIVKNCELLVVEEVNKMSVLNTFIQLLSPEHQGTQTSIANKQRASLMLFEWKNSTIGNWENISKVYNMLKNRKIIDIDINNRHRMKLEDEDKLQLLSQLLHRELPEDLNKAAELVKTISKLKGVEIDEHLTDIMEAARVKSQLLNDLLNVLENEQSKDGKLIHELFDHLISVRPTLYHWTVEMANKRDAKFSEILTLTDTLNSTIQRYKDLHNLDVIDKSDFKSQPNSPQVHFDPQSIKLDKNVGVYRKPTPHSKVGESDYLKLLAAASTSNSSSNDIKRLSNSSINEEFDDLELSNTSSPNINP